MKVLFVAAEVGPYVSVGGLSQVLYFLPKALAARGHEVAIFTPEFGTMQEKKKWNLQEEVTGLLIPVGGGKELVCNVKSHRNPKSNVTTYFLENREYYELRANVFGYKDDHVRFALMCRGVLEWLRTRREKGEELPDIIHCNDWHASYLIEMAKTEKRYRDIFAHIPILLTVHNFGYQGNYDYMYCSNADRDDLKKPLRDILDPEMQKQNALARGILYADYVNTVSPTHAREMITKEYAENLYPLMRKVRTKLSGILNGLDDHEFDPSKDKRVKYKFTIDNFAEARKANKLYLQKMFGIPQDENKFLLAYSGRLVSQKGVELINLAMKHYLKERSNTQLIVLGGGDDYLRKELTVLQTRYPEQVGLHLMSNFELPRQIFAGADILLIPSIFEPGGIVALESLRYGAVPIVRRTGGLNDIVNEFDPVKKSGNGFSFTEKSAWSLYGAIARAESYYLNPRLWIKLVKNALSSDFSWMKAASLYEEWYEQAIRKVGKFGNIEE